MRALAFILPLARSARVSELRSRACLVNTSDLPPGQGKLVEELSETDASLLELNLGSAALVTAGALMIWRESVFNGYRWGVTRKRALLAREADS